MAGEHPTGGARQAGLVLAPLGAVTYGATSPFGLVLSGEWLCDPSRSRGFRRLDWVGLTLALPGAVVFAVLSVGLFDYAPGGTSFAPMIAGYRAAFGWWLLVGRQTRWRELQHLRRAGSDKIQKRAAQETSSKEDQR